MLRLNSRNGYGLPALTSNRLVPPPLSIDSNDFNVLAHPIPRQVDAAAVPGLFDLLFNQLFPVDPELGFRGSARLSWPAADLFKLRISFQGDHILLYFGGTRFFPLASMIGNTRC